MTRGLTTYSDRPRRQVIVEGAVDVTQPIAGFYRGKLRGGGVLVGIRIWHGPPADPVTGELLDRSWRWQAEANGELADFDRVWPDCADEPISEDDYLFYARRQTWARDHAPTSAFADPRRRHDPLTAILPF